MKSLFKRNRKILIGVIHLPPLPGSPGWRGELESVIESAVADALAYERGGARAVFLENFGDVPFTKGSAGPETIAAMGRAEGRKSRWRTVALWIIAVTFIGILVAIRQM